MAHGDGQERLIAMGRLVRLAAAILIGLVCSGCLLDDSGPIAPLRQLPEANLYYPGAKVIEEVAAPRNVGPDGQGPASYGHNLAVNATPDQVIAFYDRELKSRGWVKSTESLPIVNLGDGLWTKPGVFMECWTKDPPSGQPDYSGYNLAVYVRIFEDWPPSPSPS